MRLLRQGMGPKLAAVAEDVSGVFTSTNSGVNWTRQTNGLLPYLGFDYVASSADGSKLVAAAGGTVNGPIFTSTNFGVNWTKATNAPLARWYSVTSSADGNKLMACAYFLGSVYLHRRGRDLDQDRPAHQQLEQRRRIGGRDENGGVGQQRLICFWHGRWWYLYFDEFRGGSGFQQCAQRGMDVCAMSADGNMLIATIGAPSTSGGIYVSKRHPRRF